MVLNGPAKRDGAKFSSCVHPTSNLQSPISNPNPQSQSQSQSPILSPPSTPRCTPTSPLPSPSLPSLPSSHRPLGRVHVLFERDRPQGATLLFCRVMEAAAARRARLAALKAQVSGDDTNGASTAAAATVPTTSKRGREDPEE